jgi:ABC-type bacteriocin/lantibiotic exporter with double-glycine peptidase domain
MLEKIIPGVDPTPLKRFFSLLRKDRKDIIFIYLYAIFSGLITLSIPLGIQAIIGLIAGGAMSSSLYILIAIVTIGTGLVGVLRIMQMTVTETLQRRIFTRSAFEFAYRIPHFKLDRIRDQFAPELVNRFFDTQTLQKGLPKILMDFSSAVLQIFFGLILIAFYHPFFVFFGILLILIVFLIFRISGPPGLRTSLRESDHKYEVAHWLEELARANNSFKLSGENNFALQKTDSIVRKYLFVRKKHFRILVFQFSSVVGFKILVTAALLFLGSILVIDNQINIGQFVAAEIVVILIMNSVEKLILNMETIYDMLTGIEKIGKVADQPLDRMKGTSFREIDTGQGMSIDIRDLCFRFPNEEALTIKNINMSIASGERICIAGYNRAGKSTLIHIISAFYEGYEGSLSYNGLPAKNINLNSLHRNIGEFTSQLDIFRGTVAENIRLQRGDFPVSDMIALAKEICLHHYIESLPNGYETMLLPGGKNIPGSIRAKIILARAIAAQPKLFVMEDSFGRMERDDRMCIIRYLTSPERNWTLLVVSDDPYFATQCDRVLIMRKGEIIEEGPFNKIRLGDNCRRVFYSTLEDLENE